MADPLEGILDDRERQTLIAALEYVAKETRSSLFGRDVTALAHKLELHRDRPPRFPYGWHFAETGGVVIEGVYCADEADDNVYVRRRA